MLQFVKKASAGLAIIGAALGLSMPLSIHDTRAEELPRTHLKIVGAWSFLSQYKNFEQPFWSEQIARHSGGQVTADITPFNKMGLKGTEIFRLMKLGMIDFGTTVLAYGAESDIDVEGIDLAGLSPDIATARKVVDAYFPVMEKFYQDTHQIKVLAIWPYPAQVIWCKKQITGLSDLSGLKVRVGTRPIGEFVEGLGGVSVNVPFGEAYQEIKTGNIDCAVTGALPGNSAKWYEVTNYLYPLPVGWSMAMHGVNMNTWTRLDPKVQTFLQDGINGLSDDIWAVAEDETIDGINCNTGASPCKYGTPANMKRVDISSIDQTLLQNLLRDVVIRRWAERCSDDCVAKWNNTVGNVVNMTAEK